MRSLLAARQDVRADLVQIRRRLTASAAVTSRKAIDCAAQDAERSAPSLLGHELVAQFTQQQRHHDVEAVHPQVLHGGVGAGIGKCVELRRRNFAAFVLNKASITVLLGLEDVGLGQCLHVRIPQEDACVGVVQRVEESLGRQCDMTQTLVGSQIVFLVVSVVSAA